MLLRTDSTQQLLFLTSFLSGDFWSATETLEELISGTVTEELGQETVVMKEVGLLLVSVKVGKANETGDAISSL